MSRDPVATEPLPRDAGMTMAEVLVSMMLFAVLGSVLLSFAMATARVTDRIQVSGDLTGESRLAFQRFSRELRQASDIRGVQFSTGTGTTTAITFWTDFNGNGVVDLDASDPEVLTYRWDPDNQRLTLTANDASGTAVTRPVLAGRVTTFDLQLRSSLWQHDTSGDGVPTTWQELDASVVGNRNGVPDDPELEHVDLIGVELSVTEGDVEHVFSTQTDLRNRAQS